METLDVGARLAPSRESVAGEPAAARDFSIEIVRDDAGFDALEAEWTALAARAPGAHYCHDYRWCWRIWQCIASVRGRELRIVVGRQAGRLVLVWPLMLDGRGLRSLSSDSFEYRDLLVDAGADRHAWMTAAWDAVSKLDGFDLMLLQNAKTPSNLAWLLERLPGSVWKQEKRSLLIRLDRHANWDAYAAALPKRLMADQRRQWRRLDQAAGTHFDVVDEAADIAPTIDFIIEHKLVWLASRGIAAANFGTPEYRRFLNAAANDALAGGSLVLARLFAGDKLVSAAFALKRATELTFLMFAYDFAWENYSPSRLLLERTIQWCYANGVALFDFLPGGDYKELWTNDDVVATTYMIPTTARGYAIRKWYVADVASTLERSWVKRVYRHLPARARHAIYHMLAKRKLVGLDLIRKMEAM